MRRITFVLTTLLFLFLLTGCSAKNFNFNKKAKLKNVSFEEEISDEIKINSKEFDDNINLGSLIDTYNNKEYYITKNQNILGLVDDRLNYFMKCECDEIVYIYDSKVVCKLVDKTIIVDGNKKIELPKLIEIFSNGFLYLEGLIYDIENKISINCDVMPNYIYKDGKNLIIRFDNKFEIYNKKSKKINTIDIADNKSYYVLKNGNIVVQEIKEVDTNSYDMIYNNKKCDLKTQIINYKTNGKKDLYVPYIIVGGNYITKYNMGMKAGKYLYKYDNLIVYPIVDKKVLEPTKCIVSTHLKVLHVFDSIDENIYKLDRKHFVSDIGYMYYKNDEILAKGEKMILLGENALVKNNNRVYNLIDKDGLVIDSIEIDNILYKTNDSIVYEKDQKLFIYNIGDKRFKAVNTYNLVEFFYNMILYSYDDYYVLKDLYGNTLLEFDNTYDYSIGVYNKLAIINSNNICYIIKRW